MAKVTEEEFTEIQELRESLFGILMSIGEIHLNKKLLQSQLNDTQKQLDEQENKFEEFREKERVLFERLQEKYGAGDIDIETGEITE